MKERWGEREEGKGGEGEGGGKGGDSNEDDKLNFDNDNIGRDQGGGTSLGVDPTNLFGDVVDIKGVNGASFGDDAGADEPVAVAATESTTASSCTMSRSSGGKWSLGALQGEEGNKRKPRHSRSHCVFPGSHHLTLVVMVKMGTLLEI